MVDSKDLYIHSRVQTRYPEHKTQAIGEFTTERLRSFYIADPNVMIPAISVIQEGKRLAETNHPSAALVFFGTGIELLLKATVLKPVVHGLVHSAPLADTIVEYALGQSGFDRYTKLLSKLYNEFSKLDINSIKRQGAGQNLLAECTALQDVRNKIIHRGATCSDAQAANGLEIVDAVYQSIVIPVLGALGLTVGEGGVVEPTRF